MSQLCRLGADWVNTFIYFPPHFEPWTNKSTAQHFLEACKCPQQWHKISSYLHILYIHTHTQRSRNRNRERERERDRERGRERGNTWPTHRYKYGDGDGVREVLGGKGERLWNGEEERDVGSFTHLNTLEGGRGKDGGEERIKCLFFSCFLSLWLKITITALPLIHTK